MSTEIFEGATGRSIATYDLLDEAMGTYGLDKATAHEAIAAFLQGMAQDDPTIILDRTPTRPELVQDNPRDLDVTHWLTVSDDTASHIRAALDASFDRV